MKKYPIEVGSVVHSLAGRDEGRAFIVIKEIDQDFVMVANGKLRKMDHLKKKRRRHLKPTGVVVEGIADRIVRGEMIEDHEIREWLKEEENELVQV